MPTSFEVSTPRVVTRGAWFPPPGAPSVREIRDTSLNWKIAKRMPMMPLTMMNASVAAGEARESDMVADRCASRAEALEPGAVRAG